MSIAIAKALTQQFYEWERNGRGWYKADFSVDLEPPFTPFFGHGIEGEIIDDGKRSTWLSSIRDAFKSAPIPVPIDPPFKEVDAFPATLNSPLTLYRIVLSRQFKQSGERIEQLLVMLSYRKSPISFEIIGAQDTITLQLACRADDAVFVCTQFQAFFPDCAIIETVDDELLDILDGGFALYTVDYGLQEEFMRPLATYTTGDIDTYTALFGILSRLQEDEYVILQILFCGTHNAWSDSIMTAVCDNGGKQSFLFDAPELPQLAKEKISRPLYGVTIRTVTAADSFPAASALLQHVATAMVHASKGSSNCLMPLTDASFTVHERLVDIVLRESHRLGMLLNSRELATFVHFPAPALSKKLLGTSRTTKAAPTALCNDSYTLGINSYQGVDTEVGIPIQTRLRHLHLIGSTGTGKSTLMHRLIMHDIEQGIGCCVIDPHGDLVDTILNAIPQHRIQDVVLIDPSDAQYPVCLNILSAHSDLEKELLASDLVALFRRFSTSWGDQMNSVFANAISAFVYNTKTGTLGDLRKFLIEQSYRTTILATCTDPDIVYYWQKEFPILKSSSLGSILTRLDSFLRPRVIRNMVCQERCLDFAALMDSRKIVLVKLSHGLLGEENSYLLGAFIVSKLQQTAMARQAQAAYDRIPFFCYIDEFQHFITPSMVSILSGARKYGLGLVLAHQDMQQVSKADADIASSLLANAATRICFKLGEADAKRLQEGFSSFSSDDLQQLNTGEAIVRVNTRDADFNLDVVPYEPNTADSFVSEIVEHSRNTYAVAVSAIAPAAVPPVPPPATSQYIKPIPIAPQPVQPSAPQAEQVREHRYLQTLIKKLAEERGYKASLEVPTPDGSGQVDVLLEKDGSTIAVEISVTTTAEWEVHNIEKCLAAGYSQIVVCSTDAKKLTQIRQRIAERFSQPEIDKIRLLAPNEFQSVLIAPQQQNRDMVVKGYRVKVQYEQGGGNKADLLRSIVNASKKP